MNKLKLFLENFIVFGVGGVISRIIPLIMVPIIVKLMPNSYYYGISDLANTLIQLATALATMGMYDAMYRMFFEKETLEYKKKVCSTSLFVVVGSAIIIFAIMLMFCNEISNVFFDAEYPVVVFLCALATFFGAMNNIVSAPTRMQNKRKLYLLANTITPILSYGISIPLLLCGQYLYALPVATVISAISITVCFLVINRKWFCIHLFNKGIFKQLCVIALPLVPNMLIYWIFNSCDKMMITNILGMSEAGIYSVSSKLGHCSQIIYMAFAGGWQYFAFSTMKEENQVKTNSLIFEYLGIISFAVSAFVCSFSYFIFDTFFPAEYIEGYIAAPYLFIAPLLQMLFQVISNQFLIVKRTWPAMLILLLGAVVNVIMNYILIPLIGIEGAAVATLLGYIVTNLVCVTVLRKMKLIVVSIRFKISILLVSLYVIVWRIFFSSQIMYGFLGACCLSIILFLLYIEDIRMLITAIRVGLRKKD